MQHPQINTIVIIAEGIPENMTRKIIKLADARGVCNFLNIFFLIL